MGIFDFLKGAGRKVEEQAPVAPVTPPSTGDIEKFQAARERARAAALATSLGKLIADHGITVGDLGVRVDDDTVTLTGSVDTQATREKVVLLVGNVQGIAKVDDQLTVTAPPEPPAVFHTVAKGETLSKIAKQYYGSANKYMKIFEANRPMLADPDKIYPGQVLRIPDAQVAEKAE
jgi:nucleoid-associated protein YgaU